MKTFLRLTVLVLLANLFQLSFAYDFKVGQLYYNINSDGATVSVTGENARPPAYPYESLRGDVVIPSTVTYNGVTYTVTEIGSGAFDGAVGVVNVSVPQTVTRIAGYSFRDCTNLKSINIPTAVTTIDGGTFWGCTALTSVTIPSSVTTIGSLVFWNCTGLTSVTNKATTPQDISGKNVFVNGAKVKECKLYVPQESYDLYCAADVWKDFMVEGISGVEDIRMDKQQKHGQRYNLMGQPVGDDYRGIVIQDGEKKSSGKRQG